MEGLPSPPAAHDHEGYLSNLESCHCWVHALLFACFLHCCAWARMASWFTLLISFLSLSPSSHLSPPLSSATLVKPWTRYSCRMISAKRNGCQECGGGSWSQEEGREQVRIFGRSMVAISGLFGMSDTFSAPSYFFPLLLSLSPTITLLHSFAFSVCLSVCLSLSLSYKSSLSNLYCTFGSSEDLLPSSIIARPEVYHRVLFSAHVFWRWCSFPLARKWC